jgi:hypothetical protein
MTNGQDAMPPGVARGPSGKPPHFVTGVIDDPTSFETAVDELISAGIARDSIGVLQGERGAEVIAGRHGEGIRSWLRRTSESLSDEHEYLEAYEEEARKVHFVLGVPLPDAGEALRGSILQILTRHGAHSIVSSDRWTHSGE